MNGWTTTEGINQRNIKCLSGILQTNALVVTKNLRIEIFLPSKEFLAFRQNLDKNQNLDKQSIQSTLKQF